MSNSNASRDDDIPISAKELKKAFQRIEDVLGKANTESLIYDLELQGIVLLGHTAYSLNQVKNALAQALGEESATLLTNRLRKELQIAKK